MAARSQDLLRDYRAKRDFARTSEPSGKGRASRQGGSERGMFVVQKHDATRLHFDFRIELDGVLKSWAVTRGPSNNPADKRLAVRVEDHPLDYGDFEGTIPEKEYGGGTVMLWDRGTWEPMGDPHEGIERGDLKLRLFGERMRGEWVLVHMKGRDTRRRSGPDRENWLLIKHADSYARDKDTLTTRFTRSVASGRDFAAIAKGAPATRETDVPDKAVWHSEPEKAKSAPRRRKVRASGLPEYRSPQLATLVDTVPTGSDWLFELKYDGYRCLAAVDGDDVRLYTRNGKDWTEQFGPLVDPFRGLRLSGALLDGEICAFDAKGRTDFSTLKNTLSDGGRLEFFAFDLLALEGRDWTAKPLIERKQKLKTLLSGSTGPIQYSEHVVGHGDKVLAAVCRDGHEGVIAKKPDAPYRGERTRSWLKIKCIQRQEFVIGGWSPSEKRNGFASLLVGTRDSGKLVYRGRVGTGFDQDTLQEIGEALEMRARKTSPFADVPAAVRHAARWVTPDLVAEIAYTELTADGILRHPSFFGLRMDKPAADIGLEQAAPPAAAPSADPGFATAGAAAAERLGVRLTSPDRVVYPGQGITKADLVGYYAAVEQLMLPHIADRPLSLVRCPQGRAKACFFQKHDSGGFPPELKTLPIPEKDGGTANYFYIDDLAGLIAGTQMNTLEWHIWGSRRRDIEKPDRLVFDIDPDEGLGFDVVRAAARDIRDRLADLGLVSFPLVSGGKGVHVVVPLSPRVAWPEAKAFCQGLARAMAAAEPDRFTAHLSKARRKGRLFIDYLRNERGSTAIAPWSVRSREGAPVATPIAWDELPTVPRANAFSLAAAAERANGPDPWPGYFDQRQRLTKAMLAKVDIA